MTLEDRPSIAGRAGRIPARARATSGLVWLLLFGSTWLSPAAADGPIRILEQPTVDGVDLTAVNVVSFPVTVTLELTSRTNVAARPESPITVIVPAGAEGHVTSLTRQDPELGLAFEYRIAWSPGSKDVEHDGSYVYTLPFAPGHAYLVGQGYNGKFSHAGAYALDWYMPEGTEVLAARGGRVIRVVDKFAGGGPAKEFLGKENQIWVLHDDGTIGVYAHFLRRGSRVRRGEHVATGALLGLAGSTGYSSRPHLHFEVQAPACGATRRTFPVLFETARAPRSVLVAGVSYMRPPQGDVSLSYPVNLLGAVVTSRGRRGPQPVDATTVFAASDTVWVRLGIGAPAAHTYRLDFYHDDEKRPRTTRSTRTRRRQSQAFVALDLTGFRDPRGRWRIVVSIGATRLKETTFTVE